VARAPASQQVQNINKLKIGTILYFLNHRPTSGWMLPQDFGTNGTPASFESTFHVHQGFRQHF
jgi:hypothetical protein